MTSDFFLVPMAPDYFSVMATDSLASIIPKWRSWAEKAKTNPVLKNATYPFPAKTPKFIGTIVQKYRLREGRTPSSAFQKWIKEIEDGVKNKLIPVLRNNDMLLQDDNYTNAHITLGEPVIQMSDFNSLIALSQKHKAPIFSLTDMQLESTGIVLERTKKSMKNFYDLYSDGADKIIKLTENA